MENCTLLQHIIKELKNKKELHTVCLHPSHHRMEADQLNLGSLQRLASHAPLHVALVTEHLCNIYAIGRKATRIFKVHQSMAYIGIP